MSYTLIIISLTILLALMLVANIKVFNFHLKNKSIFIYCGIYAAIVAIILAISYNSSVMDTEYLGGYLTEAFYYERWNERVSCRHEISCSHTCSSGSGKKRRTYKCHSNDGYWHSYDVDDHPPRWEVVDSNKNSWNISQHEFVKLTNDWKNNTFVELNRHYHTIDGNMYKTYWNGDWKTLQATTVAHQYENKIPVSYSIFRHRDVSPNEIKRFGLFFNYPEIQRYSQKNILSWNNVDYLDELRFQHLNAMLGKKYQVRTYVMIFNDQPIEASFQQENLWQRGNKNELDICIGVSNNQVRWARVFSWSEKVDIHKNIEDFVMSTNTLNLQSLADFLWQEIPKNWKRREFTKLNKDLQIEYPETFAYVMIILSIISHSIFTIWAYKNE